MLQLATEWRPEKYKQTWNG